MGLRTRFFCFFLLTSGNFLNARKAVCTGKFLNYTIKTSFNQANFNINEIFYFKAVLECIGKCDLSQLIGRDIASAACVKTRAQCIHHVVCSIPRWPVLQIREKLHLVMWKYQKNFQEGRTIGTADLMAQSRIAPNVLVSQQPCSLRENFGTLLKLRQSAKMESEINKNQWYHGCVTAFGFSEN